VGESKIDSGVGEEIGSAIGHVQFRSFVAIDGERKVAGGAGGCRSQLKDVDAIGSKAVIDGGPETKQKAVVVLNHNNAIGVGERQVGVKILRSDREPDRVAAMNVERVTGGVVARPQNQRGFAR